MRILGVVGILSTLGALLLWLSAAELAVAAKGQPVTAEELVSITVEIETKKGAVQKSLFCLGDIPGVVSEKNELRFQSLNDQIRAWKKQARKKPQKAKKLRKKIKNQRKLVAPAEAECQKTQAPDPLPTPPEPNPTPDDEDDDGDTPTPTPSGTPSPTETPIATPSPTPTPDSGTPMFDQDGNVTIEGKVYLEIPVDLEANVDRGFDVQQFYCTGCHGERSFWRFDQLEERIEGNPMFFQVPEQISFQDLADLTAYLNRVCREVPCF